MRITRSLLISLSLVSIGGCMTDGDVITPDRTTGLALSADVLGSTDVSGVHFRVTEAPCSAGDTVGGATWEATTDFEDMYLPGDIPLFEDKPYDAGSSHMFADRYFLLPAGCYDVLVTPLNQTGAASQDCFSAHEDAIEVVDGKTTEITLISQCQGPARGGLDVIATINHPPQIDDITYEPSKFVATCEGAEVCVTASDPDGDPLEWSWAQTNGGPLAGGIVTSTEVHADGSMTQCATLSPNEIGAYEFEVEVFDLAYDDAGELARIEDLLSAQGDPHESRDAIAFPLYQGVDCTVEDPADDADDDDATDDDDDATDDDDDDDATDDDDDDAADDDDDATDDDDDATDDDDDDANDDDDDANDDDDDDANDDDDDADDDVVDSCTYTQGYYKNHNADASNPNQQIAWPISEDTQLCGQSWLDILGTPPAGDKWYILASQYITASLNVANGASTTIAVDAALAVGDLLLPACSIAASDEADAISAASTLDAYNNGVIGDGHCDD